MESGKVCLSGAYIDLHDGGQTVSKDAGSASMVSVIFSCQVLFVLL